MNIASADRPPTIKEVAKLAGVSFKTVARVVNGEPNVSTRTRDAVLSAMRMLKYAPNISGRQLKSRRSYLIALLFRVSANFVGRAQTGAITKCRETGYHVIVEEVPEGFEEEVTARLQHLRVDGVILLPPLSYDPIILQALRDKDLKVVQIAPDDPEAPFASVGINDFEAGQAVTQRLIQLGHKEIAFVSGEARRASASRFEGFRAAMAKADLRLRPEHVRSGQFTFEGGERAGRELLSLSPRPTAIFAANDVMALGVMVSAQKLGLKIPDEISIAGFDDTPAASYSWPQLTTVRQPLEEMTTVAVEMVLDEQRRAARESYVLPYEVIERGSIGVPPR